MKKKLVRRLAMLLAVTIFMTQVSYFPAKAAEISAEEAAATEAEAESETETEIESEVETVAESETKTIPETELMSEVVTQTDIVTETDSIAETEGRTETSTVPGTATEAETEEQTGTETEITEEQLESSDTSLSGISFLFSDIRDLEETASKALNTDDGKQAVYVFGKFTTCQNTATAVRVLSECVTYYDKDKIQMYVIDISDNDKQDLVSWLDSNNISEDVAVSSILSSSNVKNFYYTCVEKTTGYGSFTMPIIVYKGTDGTIYTHTTGYQTEAKICANIEAGGLSKIETGDLPSVVSLNVEYHTVDEIEAYMSKSGITGKETISYKRNPVTSGNYNPGELSFETLNTALDTLNQVRYIAGISHDITINDSYNELCQAASLVNYVNGELSHYPAQPSNMSDALYQLGAEGAASSNLSWRSNGGNFYSMIEGQMSDNSGSNLESLGHRRWLINPEMKQTGFGVVGGSKGTYGAIYSIDNGFAGTQIKVAWPAQSMPTTYFTTSDPWSISVNETVDMSTVKVSLTREADKKQWNFSESAADGYFNVNNQRYGQPGCIIFRPTMAERNYADGDLYHIEITYNNKKITYDVQFFEPLKTYSVTYELNGGINNSDNPTDFRVFSDTIVLKEPAKEYSKFDGWYTDSGFKNKITQIDKGTNKNIKLYAKWKDIVTKITLDQSLATLKEGQTFQLNAQITSDENVNTIAWKSSDENVATVNENGLVTAKAAGSAVITAASYGKQAVCNVKVIGTTKAPAANIPTNTEVGKGTLITLTSETTGAVIYYTTDNSDPTAKSKVYKEPIAINEDTTIKAYASSNGNEDSAVVTMTYTLKSFTVTFDTDGGSVIESLKVYQNDAADEPILPVKEGYNFVGWYLAGKPYDFSTPVTADLTLKAVWKEYDALSAPVASLKSDMEVEAGTRVALSHPMSGVTIYYTTDDSTPTVKSTEYKNAIIINNEMTIRAIAVKEGYKHSEAAKFHYTVAEKGSLWGDVVPEDIPNTGDIPKGIWVKGIEDVTYTGKAVTHEIRVYDGNTLLIEKKDYTVSYKNNTSAAKATDAKAPTVIINGKGNYNDKKVIPFNINPKNISDSDVTADEITLAYTGKTKKVIPTITYKQKKLANNKDFAIMNPSDYSEAKKYTISVEGKGNYTGTKNITLTVTNKTLINKASVTKIQNQIYDGKTKTPAVTVKLKKELVLNQDYTLSYENNREIGTASIVIQGKGEYAGIKRVTFKIVSPYKGGKYDIGKDEEKLIDVDIDSTAVFLKGGCTPAVRVSCNGKRLSQGKDYTVSFKDNKAAYAVSGKNATAVISGKGSYCGKITKSFRIKTKDLSDTTLLVNDKVYTGKAKGHVTKFTLTDTDGKAMKAGTDYEKEILYTYASPTELENGERKSAGDMVGDTDIVPAGTTIRVTVKGKGSYENSITGEYRIIAKENDISKAKITLKTPQYYTGSAVEPDESQFEVKIGEKTLMAGEYKIVGYTNNIKKGNATVMIRGEGTYGGTKTAKFAIGFKAVGTMEVK